MHFTRLRLCHSANMQPYMRNSKNTKQQTDNATHTFIMHIYRWECFFFLYILLLCKCSFSLFPCIQQYLRYLNTEYCEFSSAYTQQEEETERENRIQPRLRVLKRSERLHMAYKVHFHSYRCTVYVARAREIQHYGVCMSVLSISLFIVYSFSFDWNSTKQAIVRIQYTVHTVQHSHIDETKTLTTNYMHRRHKMPFLLLYLLVVFVGTY